MEVGEIIRKMSSSGEPYGSLAIVEKIEGEIIIAKYINKCYYVFSELMLTKGVLWVLNKEKLSFLCNPTKNNL